MILNVNPDVEDVYYRYKMPRINVKVEGKGNGIKSVITNMGEIAKSIYRKPSYAIKYFGIELGSQINIDDKNEKYIVNGAHDGGKLQETLYNFIKKFVLCSKCGNPETTLTIKKKSEKVVTKCKACGEVGLIDMKHKLTPYIIKNPPENESEGAPPPKTTEEYEEPEIMTGIDDSKGDDDDSALGAGSSQKKKASQTVNRDVKKSAGDEFYHFVTEKFKNGTLLDERAKVKTAFRQMKLKESSIVVVVEAVFVTLRTILDDIKKYKQLFQIFTRIGPSGEKFQQYIIVGMLLLCEKFNIEQYAIYLLKAFYDNDIIEEDVIMEWYEKGPTKKFIKKEKCQLIMNSCTPFIDWLKSADEERLSDDEDDNNRKGPRQLQFQVISDSQASNIIAATEDEEFNIDDI